MTDYTEGRNAMMEGIAKADAAANPTWKDYMYDLVVEVAKNKQQFTSDDVFELHDTDPTAPITHERRAFGPVILRAMRNGICTSSGQWVPSVRPEVHMNRITLWNSLIYGTNTNT